LRVLIYLRFISMDTERLFFKRFFTLRWFSMILIVFKFYWRIIIWIFVWFWIEVNQLFLKNFFFYFIFTFFIIFNKILECNNLCFFKFHIFISLFIWNILIWKSLFHPHLHQIFLIYILSNFFCNFFC
jgi:hypothetical protein